MILTSRADRRNVPSGSAANFLLNQNQDASGKRKKKLLRGEKNQPITRSEVPATQRDRRAETASKRLGAGGGVWRERATVCSRRSDATKDARRALIKRRDWEEEEGGKKNTVGGSE